MTWHSQLAREIKDTWTLGPKEGTWYKWLSANIDDEHLARTVVADLRAHHDSTTLTTARFRSEYVKAIAARNLLTQPEGPHAHCVACHGNGYVEAIEASPIDGTPRTYATACDGPIAASCNAEHNYHFNPNTSPTKGRKEAERAQRRSTHYDGQPRCTRCTDWAMPCTTCNTVTQYAQAGFYAHNNKPRATSDHAADTG